MFDFSFQTILSKCFLLFNNDNVDVLYLIDTMQILPLFSSFLSQVLCPLLANVLTKDNFQTK